MTDSSSIAFDPERHARLLVVLTRAAAAIQEELDALDQAVRTLRSQWSGEAEAAYAEAHAQWTAAMAELQTALTEATDYARAGGEALAAAEESASALWG